MRHGRASRKRVDAALLLADSKGDPKTAARVLDGAMSATTDAPASLLVRARILRADVALAMGEDTLAGTLLEEAARVPLGPDDRVAAADELARADDLRRTLG